MREGPKRGGPSRSRVGAGGKARRDDRGQLWDRKDVDRAVIAIVARLARRKPQGITRRTSFAATLKWDRMAKLSLIGPVRSELHESLPAGLVVRGIHTVGQLCDTVWRMMEEA